MTLNRRSLLKRIGGFVGGASVLSKTALDSPERNILRQLKAPRTAVKWGASSIKVILPEKHNVNYNSISLSLREYPFGETHTRIKENVRKNTINEKTITFNKLPKTNAISGCYVWGHTESQDLLLTETNPVVPQTGNRKSLPTKYIPNRYPHPHEGKSLDGYFRIVLNAHINGRPTSTVEIRKSRYYKLLRDSVYNHADWADLCRRSPLGESIARDISDYKYPVDIARRIVQEISASNYRSDQAIGIIEDLASPAETLVHGAGDCEDGAGLLYSILSSDVFDFSAGLVFMPFHVGVGVTLRELLSSYNQRTDWVEEDPISFTIRDDEYVFVEATTISETGESKYITSNINDYEKIKFSFFSERTGLIKEQNYVESLANRPSLFKTMG